MINQQVTKFTLLKTKTCSCGEVYCKVDERFYLGIQSDVLHLFNCHRCNSTLGVPVGEVNYEEEII